MFNRNVVEQQKVKVAKSHIKPQVFDDPNEQIKLNVKFSSNNIRVNLVPTSSQKRKDPNEKTKEEKEAEKSVQVERQVIIQATSVKVMKTRKTVAY